MKSEIRVCQNCKHDFTIEPEDFSFYERIKVPPPTFCPECRNQRRMSWRNERTLYKRKCNAPGHTEEIISMYEPNFPGRVVDNEYWWSDKWDAMEYGRDYDFSRPFFEQFLELFQNIPLSSLSTLNSINSKYTNFVDGNKNCYLIFASGWSEDCRYGTRFFKCKDSQDLFMCENCELCYECVKCTDSNRLFYSLNSKECIESYFLYNCRNCQHCFGCSNLVNKSYCIWNKQYTREDYFKELEKMDLTHFSNLVKYKEEFYKNIYLKSVHRYVNMVSSNLCIGDNIKNSKKCISCFEIYGGAENCKYLYGALDIKDSYDGNGVFKNELSYECVDCNVDSRNMFGVTIYESEDVGYVFNCHDLKNSFGCVGLRKKQYCILNKQYTKEEYEVLVEKIKKHMMDMPYIDKKGRVYKYGEFFPTELSPFGYNATIANEFYPINKDKVNDSGFRWVDRIEQEYKTDIYNKDIPDDARTIEESFISKVVECGHREKCHEQCTGAFKLIPEEVSFYQRLKIPLPHLCPNCRHYQRLAQINPMRLWHRKCMKEGCNNEFETSYAPERPEIVYCEKCYQQEVY